MRLTELEPHWMTEVHPGGHQEDRAGSQVDAQGIRLLCPKCFAENSGKRGTHSIIVPFANRGVPDDAYPGMARWAASGSTFDDLTTTPSILLLNGCAWHGFITNGEVT